MVNPTPYEHPEDVDNGTNEDPTIEDRCEYCGRLFFHMTTCPNFTGDNIAEKIEAATVAWYNENSERASDPEC